MAKQLRQRRSSASRRPGPRLAGRADDAARHGDGRGDRPSLWPRRVPAPPGPSLLVPVVRRGDGDGLAFVGHHHQRRSARSSAASTRAPASSASRSAAGAARHSRADPGRARRRPASAAGFDGADAGHAPAGSSPRSTAPRVQDGFDLYLHGFFVTDDGKWAVVQQGMNGDSRTARRYHWLSEGLSSFVDAPHAAIEGRRQGEIVNLADRRAEASRRRPARAARRARTRPARPRGGGDRRRRCRRRRRAVAAAPRRCRTITTSAPSDVILRRLHGTLAAAAEAGPKDFAELLLVPGVGARTVRSLAMVAEVIHGAPCRFADPARFSLAHGGKDRHPFPVPTKVYDKTIGVLKSRGRAGEARQRREARRDPPPRRAGAAARARMSPGRRSTPSWPRSGDRSHDYGGRSVFGWEPPAAEAGAA